MAYNVPDGSKTYLGTTVQTAIAFTAITNANPAVCSSVAHGLSNGDMIIVTSGWSKINDRIYKVASVTADTFALSGLDTTSTTTYPAGEGAGTVSEISAYTQITQILTMGTSGGDQQFAPVSPMDLDFDSQLPTRQSAQTLTFTVGDDDSLAGYTALRAAHDAGTKYALKLQNKNGSTIHYYGYVSLNETPTKTSGQVDVVNVSFSLASRPVRYSA